MCTLLTRSLGKVMALNIGSLNSSNSHIGYLPTKASKSPWLALRIHLQELKLWYSGNRIYIPLSQNIEHRLPRKTANPPQYARYCAYLSVVAE